jgi:predicted transcriptional regulator
MADEIKMTIRLTPEMHERLSRAAEHDHRSKHAQMITYIERCLDQEQDHDHGEAHDGRQDH